MTGHFGKPPTAEEEKALFAAMHDPKGSPASRAAARDEIVVRNLPLVAWALKRVRHPFTTTDDLFGHGAVALIEAVDRFDPGRGLKLSTFARGWIRGRVLRMVVDSEYRIRVPAYVYGRERGWKARNTGAEVALAAARANATGSYGDTRNLVTAVVVGRSDEGGGFDDAPTPADAVDRLLAGLDADSAELLRRYYGIDRPQEGSEQIGRTLGISGAGVRWRLNKIRKAIREEVAA